MNALLIGTLVLLLTCTLVGYFRGFIRQLVRIAAWILTFWLVSVTVPYITDFLREHTGLYAAIQNGVSRSDMELFRMLRIVGLEDLASGFVADKLVNIIGFVITTILVAVVVHGAAAVLHLASHLPLLHGVNRFLGGAVGFLEGLLLIWVGNLVLCACSTSQTGIRLLQMVADSPFLTWLFTQNPLLSIIGK